MTNLPIIAWLSSQTHYQPCTCQSLISHHSPAKCIIYILVTWNDLYSFFPLSSCIFSSHPHSFSTLHLPFLSFFFPFIVLPSPHPGIELPFLSLLSLFLPLYPFLTNRESDALHLSSFTACRFMSSTRWLLALSSHAALFVSSGSFRSSTAYFDFFLSDYSELFLLLLIVLLFIVLLLLPLPLLLLLLLLHLLLLILFYFFCYYYLYYYFLQALSYCLFFHILHTQSMRIVFPPTPLLCFSTTRSITLSFYFHSRTPPHIIFVPFLHSFLPPKPPSSMQLHIPSLLLPSSFCTGPLPLSCDTRHTFFPSFLFLA